MQYSLTTDAGLPTSENHTFNDDVEQGIAIFKLQSGRYYITHSQNAKHMVLLLIVG